MIASGIKTFGRVLFAAPLYVLGSTRFHALGLWFLVFGVNERRWHEQARASRGAA